MTFTVSAKNDDYCNILIKTTGKKYKRKPQTEIFAMEIMREKIFVETLEGRMTARKGDYLVLGTANELYPVKKEIFEKIYEVVEN